MGAAIIETTFADTLPGKSLVKIDGSETCLFVKHVFDNILATVTGALLLIPMAILADLIRVDSEGPVLFRPKRACFSDKFEPDIPNFRDRLLVRPGLTGYAQVNGGYELLPEKKYVFDMEYIANCGVKRDLKCLLRTVMAMFSHDGAR